jgi:hypothetical protein
MVQLCWALRLSRGGQIAQDRQQSQILNSTLFSWWNRFFVHLYSVHFVGTEDLSRKMDLPKGFVHWVGMQGGVNIGTTMEHGTLPYICIFVATTVLVSCSAIGARLKPGHGIS